MITMATVNLIDVDCGDRYDEDEMYLIDGSWYCCNCSIYCDCCDERVPNSYINYYDELNMHICNDCRDENFTTCDCCDDLCRNDDVTWVESTDEYVCDHCLRTNYTYVESEDDYFLNEEVKECKECGSLYVIEDGDKGLCPDCKEKETGDE